MTPDNTKTSTTLQAIYAALLLAAAYSMTGCAGLAGEGWGAGDKGRILISADAEGMNAFSDLLQGSIVNGKASPDTPTQHYELRKEQNRARAMRYMGSPVVKPAARPQQHGAVQLGAEYK